MAEALIQRPRPAHSSDFRRCQGRDLASEICSETPEVCPAPGSHNRLWAELGVIHQQEIAYKVYGDAQPAPTISHLPQIYVRCAALCVSTLLFRGGSIIKIGVMGSFQLRSYAAGGWTDWIGDGNHCHQYRIVVLTKLLLEDRHHLLLC